MRTSKGETKTSLKKGAWSVEEDNKLIAYINRYGIWNWSHMPKFAGLSRSGKSCRLRWMNYLKPDLKKGRFSEEEEQSILHFHSILGNRWSAIARKLPGRSDNEIKNYWHTNLKKHVANKQAVKKSKQTKINTPPCSESDNNLDKTQESANQSEDDNSISISSSPSSNNYEVEYATPDIGSPGTIEDLQCFWRELYPLEDLEIGNLDQELMFLDNVFQESYDDPIGPLDFCNDDYEMITPRSSV